MAFACIHPQSFPRREHNETSEDAIAPRHPSQPPWLLGRRIRQNILWRKPIRQDLVAGLDGLALRSVVVCLMKMPPPGSAVHPRRTLSRRFRVELERLEPRQGRLASCARPCKRGGLGGCCLVQEIQARAQVLIERPRERVEGGSVCRDPAFVKPALFNCSFDDILLQPMTTKSQQTRVINRRTRLPHKQTSRAAQVKT